MNAKPYREDITVISCGGTLDKIYDPLSGELVVGPPVIFSLLPFDCEPVSPFQLDSLHMGEREREVVADLVRETRDDAVILISHGTDTMELTARKIAAFVSGTRRRVVIFGSMIPLSFSPRAAFDAGFALRVLETSQPGTVLMCMDGQAMNPFEWTKDRTRGCFVKIEDRR